MKTNQKRLEGIYLVLDPSMERDVLLPKLEESLLAGINVVQLWNNWSPKAREQDKRELVTDVLKISAPFNVPVLVNEDWQLLLQTELDGVHFDEIPNDFERIKQQVGHDRIIGLTCGNDLGLIEWAEEQGLDYLSFCAMFPSRSVDSCTIVHPETVQKARSITKMPIFLSGGILPGNLSSLKDLDFQGVAIISGIMDSQSIPVSISAYKNSLNERTKMQP